MSLVDGDMGWSRGGEAPLQFKTLASEWIARAVEKSGSHLLAWKRKKDELRRNAGSNVKYLKFDVGTFECSSVTDLTSIKIYVVDPFRDCFHCSEHLGPVSF